LQAAESLCFTVPSEIGNLPAIQECVPSQAKSEPQPGEQILEIRRLLHDASNVLTGLLITAGLLRHLVPLPATGERYASELESSAERAVELFSDVRSRIHRLQGSLIGASVESTKVCDARPSLGQRNGED
jgi:hypothetical protein